MATNFVFRQNFAGSHISPSAFDSGGCAAVKADGVFGTVTTDRAASGAIMLDEQPRFSQYLSSLTGSELSGGLAPLSSSSFLAR
jgi:hypothetical protein